MDSESLTGIAILIGIVVAIGLVAFFAIRAERRLQEGLQAMAQARGWSYAAHKTRGLGRGRTRKGFTVTPGDPAEGWKLEVTRRSSSSSGNRGRGGSTTRSTDPGRAEFHAPEPRFSGGLAVFTTGATGGVMGLGGGSAADSVMGMFDNKFGKAMLGLMMGADIGEHAGQLKSFPAPEGSGLSIMATADPTLFFDIDAIDAALQGWRPSKGRFASAPQLIIGEAGIRIMVSQQITDPEAVAGLIEMGQTLSAQAMRSG